MGCPARVPGSPGLPGLLEPVLLGSILDRLSRSLADLIGIVGTLRRQGVAFKSLHEALDTTTALAGRLVFHVFAGLAEFIRELIVEGTGKG